MAVEITGKKKNRRSKKSKVISFDAETITRDEAKQFLAHTEISPVNEEKSHKSNKKHKKDKRHKVREAETPGEKEEISENSRGTGEMADPPPLKKRKRNQIALEKSQEDDTDKKDDGNQLNSKRNESIREQKRKKHAKLLAEMKLKTEVSLQQKALNYLSKWKHSRDDWKFEKLRQVWIQQNMFDSVKIPDEFWVTLVEYFSNSKGQIRNVILKDALKLVEKEDDNVEYNDELKIKISRAREIVQSLQE